MSEFISRTNEAQVWETWMLLNIIQGYPQLSSYLGETAKFMGFCSVS